MVLQNDNQVRAAGQQAGADQVRTQEEGGLSPPEGVSPLVSRPHAKLRPNPCGCRLAKYFSEFLSTDERRALEGEVVRKCLSRTDKQVRHADMPSCMLDCWGLDDTW